MYSKGFMQYASDSVTTLSEIARVHALVGSEEFIGVFAYATQSGVASFDLSLGHHLWEAIPSRWLFGIDYGRTQPKALRSLCEKANSEVRIVDGEWVVEQAGFIPRRDFHAKMALLLSPSTSRFGAIIGSGNFSSNGLRNSIEAGASIVVDGDVEYSEALSANVCSVNEIWASATPAERILDIYEDRWSESIARRIERRAHEESDLLSDIFWIEAGYVTRNRGQCRPGNQIDFPRGTTARYFGFDVAEHLAPNTVIGPVTFETPIGGLVTNNLRLGNNMMEKISLPIPETHGFDIYDGKVLVFQRSEGRFVMKALEAGDFEVAFGDKVSGVMVMGSGRRYGFAG